MSQENSFAQLLDQASETGLDQHEAYSAMQAILSGNVPQLQIAAYLASLKTRGETVAELTGSVQAMRDHMQPAHLDGEFIDCCGTGGDHSGSLNISTAAAFVAAGAGCKIAKHGNRAATSKSGSSQMLEALGLHLDLSDTQLRQLARETGFCFLFAPNHHPAMRFAAPVRQELGKSYRTLFNLLGPMSNPASVRRQIIGVFDPYWAKPMAQVLQALGSDRVWLVHSAGMDELSCAAVNEIVKLENGAITSDRLNAAELGLPQHSVDALRGGEPAENAKALLALLQGKHDAYRDTVLLNAAAIIYLAGLATDLPQALEKARHSIDNDDAYQKFQQVRDFTQSCI